MYCSVVGCAKTSLSFLTSLERNPHCIFPGAGQPSQPCSLPSRFRPSVAGCSMAQPSNEGKAPSDRPQNCLASSSGKQSELETLSTPEEPQRSVGNPIQKGVAGQSSLQEESAQVLAAAAELLGPPADKAAGNEREWKEQRSLVHLRDSTVKDDMDEMGLNSQFPVSSASRGSGKLLFSQHFPGLMPVCNFIAWLRAMSQHAWSLIGFNPFRTQAMAINPGI